jgi:hypothetical protein
MVTVTWETVARDTGLWLYDVFQWSLIGACAMWLVMMVCVT